MEGESEDDLEEEIEKEDGEYKHAGSCVVPVVTLHMVDIQIIVGQGKSYLFVDIEHGEHIDVLLPHPRPYRLPSNPSLLLQGQLFVKRGRGSRGRRRR